jgi:glycosyltransferase involved in cell wall biosynthesis
LPHQPEVATRYSVVLPAYNALDTINLSLQSIQDQTLAVAEVIVIDDGSTDSTAEIARSWVDRLPMKLLANSSNQGVVSSLNLGVAAATGDWILRLDADDAWTPEHVATIDQLRRQPGVVLVSTQAIFRDAQTGAVSSSAATRPNKIRSALMFRNPIVQSAAAYSRDAFQHAGGYAPGVNWEDWDLWIRILRFGGYATTERVTVSYLVRPDSLSRSNLEYHLAKDKHCMLAAISAHWKQHPVSALCAATRVILTKNEWNIQFDRWLRRWLGRLFNSSKA